MALSSLALSAPLEVYDGPELFLLLGQLPLFLGRITQHFVRLLLSAIIVQDGPATCSPGRGMHD